MKNILSAIKPLSLSIALAVSSIGMQSLVAEEFTTPQSVFSNNQGSIAPQLNFSQPTTGDIYLAYRINGTGDYFFITKEGSISTEALPYDHIDAYTGPYTLPQFDTFNIPAGHYQLYQVMVVTNESVFDINNWIGGFGALNSLNFSVGNSAEADGDLNNDGFHDDDLNHDGFHDDDNNQDGFHDDDNNQDGFHDDDNDQDGFHDDDLNHDGFHDESNDNGSDDNGSDGNDSDGNDSDGNDSDGNDSDGNDSDGNDSDGNDSDGNDSDDSNSQTPTPTPTPTPTTPTTTSSASVTRGQATYSNNCTGCHGTNPLNNQSSILRASSAATTSSAIARNKGGMGYLSTLSSSDLQDIADYINSL